MTRRMNPEIARLLGIELPVQPVFKHPRQRKPRQFTSARWDSKTGLLIQPSKPIQFAGF